MEDPEIIEKIGEAWKDSRGIIWGDLVIDNDREVKEMTFEKAVRYCKSRDARLPTIFDLVGLGIDLGGSVINKDLAPGVEIMSDQCKGASINYPCANYQESGYQAKYLPNLGRSMFWSSSIAYGDGGRYYGEKAVFLGSSGEITARSKGYIGYFGGKHFVSKIGVRCVISE